MLSRVLRKRFLFVCFLSLVSWEATAGLIELKDFNYPLQPQKLGSDVWVNYTLVEKGTFLQLRKNSLYKRVTDAIYPSGISDNGSYYALIIRSSYLVKQPRDTYVRSEVLFDVRFMEAMMSRQGIRKLSSSVFEIPGSSFVPAFKVEQWMFSDPAELKDSLKVDVTTMPFEGKLGVPLVIVQDSTEFGTILGNKTSRDGRVVNLYYEVSPDTFLVENITLSHLHNVPPGLFGGVARLKRDYMQAIEYGVKQAQNYRP